MDTTVTGIGSVVVAELRAAGYMESTIGQYEKSIKALTGFAEDRGGVYTPALGAAFASMTISPRTGRFSAQRRFDYRRLVGVFDSYVGTGRVELVVPQARRGWRATGLERVHRAGCRVGGRHGRPCPGAGHPRRLRPGSPRLPGVPGVTRDPPPRAMPTGPACWGSWNRCRAGGRRRRCSGWCRTSARS